MAINSRAKGCRGERAFRDVLREAGYNARRGAQYSGHVEAPDVICNDLPDIHFEVKCVEAGNPYKWVEQAIRDSKRIKHSVVAHKRNGKPWLAIMEMRDFLEIVRRSDLPSVTNRVDGGSDSLTSRLEPSSRLMDGAHQKGAVMGVGNGNGAATAIRDSN